MTDTDGEPSRFIRARQRDPNSSIIGFDANLSPAIEEVGVDALRFSLSGSWTSHAGNGLALFENALSLVDVDWLNRPERQRTRITLETSRRSNTSTISSFDMMIWPADRTQGQLRIKLHLNPTRVLHHQITEFSHLRETGRLAGETNFLDYLSGLIPTEFFAKSFDLETGAIRDLPTSLDGGDNWLPSPETIRDQLGRDFWPGFLNILANKIRLFCIALMGETPSAIQHEASDSISVTDGEVWLDWQSIRVPQIECYFERYHATAASAVRYGAWNMLSADHSTEALLYTNPETFERDNDRFSVIQTLPNKSSLAIYAKRQDRIRFEVRRRGRGNYSALAIPEYPEQRLIDILALERENLLTAMRWTQIGELFAGPDHPNIHDMRTVIDRVCRNVGDDAALTSHLLNSLLIDGSISVSRSTDEDRELKQIILQLVNEGLLVNALTRSRDLNGRRRRYILKAPYRDIHRLFADPLS